MQFGFIKAAVGTPGIRVADCRSNAEAIIALIQRAKRDGAQITDDCSAVELLGMSVKIVEGDERNIKITTPVDLKLAEAFLEDME